MNRILVAAVAACALGVAAGELFSQDKAPPVRIGFVDVSKAFDTYRKRKDVDEQLRRKGDELELKYKTADARINQKAERLNTLNEGSDERADLEREIRVDKAIMEIDRKADATRFQQEARRKKALLYKEICNEAQAYGMQNGFAAILQYMPLDADFERASELDLVMSTRGVLCRDDSLDVTAEVVQRLNAMLPPAPDKPPAPTAPDKDAPKDGK